MNHTHDGEQDMSSIEQKLISKDIVRVQHHKLVCQRSLYIVKGTIQLRNIEAVLAPNHKSLLTQGRPVGMNGRVLSFQ
jgi:hypothetical protein